MKWMNPPVHYFQSTFQLIQELTSLLPEPSQQFLEQTKRNKQNVKQISKEEKLWRSKILQDIPLLKNEIHDPRISEVNFEKDWKPPDLSFLYSFSNSREDPFDKLTLNYDVKGVCEKSIKVGIFKSGLWLLQKGEIIRYLGYWVISWVLGKIIRIEWYDSQAFIVRVVDAEYSALTDGILLSDEMKF